MSISQDTVDMVVSMLAPDFDQVFVMDYTLRRQLVRQMLEEEDFVSEALGKYDLMELLREGGDCTDMMMGEKPRTVNLVVKLTGAEQLLLQRNNRDVTLQFEPGPSMPHAYYYAQRIIDTDRCLRSLSHYGGEIIDIGGNYAAHSRQCRIVHSCTLLDSAREAHRQIERQVKLVASKRCVDSLDYCVAGVQKCNHQATQSMSIHAITDIPWADWPEIMDRHGLSYHVAVFHYDPIMLSVAHGVLDGGFMYYNVHDGKVTFHFESDSSFDYTHDWENFKKYVAPWCQFSKTTDWAYLYDLKSVVGGVATAEIVRVPRADIGIQVPKPTFAYVPMEHKVSVTTWMYDLTSGLATDDPVAYEKVDLMVEKDMYNFLYMYGLSNDTANPNRPMSLDEFRAMGRTYNQTRRFGDVSVTAKRKIGSLTAHTVYDAIYHVVCRERAMLSAKSAALTTAMMLNQRAVNQSALTVAVMLPLCAVGAAFIASGDCFAYYFKRFTHYWKQCLAGKLKIASTDTPSSYVPIRSHGYADVDGYHPNVDVVFDRPDGMLLAEPISRGEHLSFDSDASSMVSDEDSSAQPFLEGSVTIGDVSDTLVGSNSGTKAAPYKLRRSSEEQLITSDQLRDIMVDSSQSIVTDELVNSDYRVDQPELLAEYQRTRVSVTPVKFGTEVERDVERLHRLFRPALLEYAVYNFDIGRGVVAELKLQSEQIFNGVGFDRVRLENFNAGQGLGLRTFEVFNGKLPTEAGEFAMGMDPLTKKSHVIRRGKDGRPYLNDNKVQFFFVSSVTRVFNCFAIGRGVLKSLRGGYKPNFRMTLVDGVPGCGKTAEIIKKFTMADVIMCAVRDSKDDTLSRLIKSGKFNDDMEDLKLRVRTLDSLIMHGFAAGGPVDRVFVDEGLMAFPGQLYAALERVRPRSVLVFGDSQQIKVIDRSPTLGSLIYRGIPLWSSVEVRDVSYSMPADVCVILSKMVYKRPVYTTSRVRRSVSVTIHKSPTDEVFVVGKPGIDYMSILTADKAKLLTGLRFVDGKKQQRQFVDTGQDQDQSTMSRVFTVHEAQGQRLDRTIAVRMNPNTAAVLNSVEHVVVALSRHYTSFEYHSLSRDDLLFQYASQLVTDDEMNLIVKSKV